VVANLVGNAVKFTPRGGRVLVSIHPTPDGATIEVTDTGIGIDASELPHIFERFYRGARSDARSTGSGLGLAIVKSIVDLHHGRIAVTSRVDEGSTFEVRLPRDPELRAISTTGTASGDAAAERQAAGGPPEAAARGTPGGAGRAAVGPSGGPGQAGH
jgi:K+-sensing histidine kinase KdpD